MVSFQLLPVIISQPGLSVVNHNVHAGVAVFEKLHYRTFIRDKEPNPVGETEAHRI